MKTVIYDSINRLVWVKNQRSVKSKNPDGIYGKDAKRFKSNVQSRAYAINLAKKMNGRVYDKYYGEYLKRKTKENLYKQKASTNFLSFGNDITKGLMR
jgi:hypothetical protein